MCSASAIHQSFLRARSFAWRVLQAFLYAVLAEQSSGLTRTCLHQWRFLARRVSISASDSSNQSRGFLVGEPITPVEVSWRTSLRFSHFFSCHSPVPSDLAI